MPSEAFFALSKMPVNQIKMNSRAPELCLATSGGKKRSARPNTQAGLWVRRGGFNFATMSPPVHILNGISVPDIAFRGLEASRLRALGQRWLLLILLNNSGPFGGACNYWPTGAETWRMFCGAVEDQTPWLLQ